MDPYFFTMPSSISGVNSPASSAGAASILPPPAAPPSAIQGTIINAPPIGENDHLNENFVDNYSLDADDGGEYTLCQKMVHYCGGHIAVEHLAACKAVLVFQAGCSISKLSSMTKVVKEAAMMELYNASIAALDEIHFGDSARLFFSRSFRKKDELLTAESLYRYYLDSRAKMRNQMLPLFPKDFVTMKSGRGFHESCNDVYVKAYRDEMMKVKRGTVPKYTKTEIENMLPPHLWEFSKSPWLFGLALKIFRRDPQLAPNVADVLSDIANLPVSRAELRRQKQRAFAVGKDNRSSTFTTLASISSSIGGGCGAVLPPPATNPNDATTTKKLLWAKVIASKAQGENTNIAKRMGKMEELEKGIALLDKIREVIGEES